MKVIATVIIIFIGEVVFAQAPLVKQWDRRFGGTKNDILYSFQQTSDGGYILGGSSKSDNDGDKTQSNWDTALYYPDNWIIKIDSLGNKEWDKRFGGKREDELYCLNQTKDKGYILGGFSMSDSSGDKSQPGRGLGDYWVIKIDSLGNKGWDKRFGGSGTDVLYSVKQTNDGGYILGGSSDSDSSGDKSQNNWNSGWHDFWIVKIDSLGNKKWDRRFGGYLWEAFSEITQTKDGGYLAGGYTSSDPGGDISQPSWAYQYLDYWIIKIDSSGNKQWDKRFGGFFDEYLQSLVQTTDGGYILYGFSQSELGGDITQSNQGPRWTSDYWVVKTDSNGNKQWDRRFGGSSDESLNYNDKNGNIVQTKDGGYFMTGNSRSPISGDKSESNLGLVQTWVVKIDSAGNKQWDKTLFTVNPNHADILPSFGLQSKDGCYVIANADRTDIGGYKTEANWDTSKATYDFWIIKFCDTTSAPVITSTTADRIENDLISVFPNPTSTTWQLQVGNNFIGSEALVSDASGKVVFQSAITNPQSAITFKAARGVYFLRISSATGSATRKLVRW